MQIKTCFKLFFAKHAFHILWQISFGHQRFNFNSSSSSNTGCVCVSHLWRQLKTSIKNKTDKTICNKTQRFDKFKDKLLAMAAHQTMITCTDQISNLSLSLSLSQKKSLTDWFPQKGLDLSRSCPCLLSKQLSLSTQLVCVRMRTYACLYAYVCMYVRGQQSHWSWNQEEQEEWWDRRQRGSSGSDVMKQQEGKKKCHGVV